jgi:hypothetical protein
MIQQWAALEAQLDSIMVSFTSPSNSLSFSQNQQQVMIQNNYANQPNTPITIANTTIMSLNSSSAYCSFISQSLTNASADFNCSSANFIQKTALGKVAVAGANGNSLNLNSSQTVTLSFFQSNNQPLLVQNLTTPLSIWIPRNSEIQVPAYQTIEANYTATMQCGNNDTFLQNSFYINTSSSIHFQFKPVTSNASLGYLALLKFGSSPQLNSSYSNYDLWQLFCPTDSITQLNDTFFLLFANQSTVNGFIGTVGVAVRELTSNEMTSYCPNNTRISNIATPPVITSPNSLNQLLNFTNCKIITNDLSFRVYLSGCYYMNTTTGLYSSSGTVIQPDTNLFSTHCLVYHCTEFAGGFIVLPATINFQQAFSSDNASIAKNPVLYATVFSIIGLYVVLALLCRFFDMRDRNRKGVTLLNGSRIKNLYEIVVFTGNRRNAGTCSNVFMSVHGSMDNSNVIEMKDKKRKLFKRGAFDTFIISTEQ